MIEKLKKFTKISNYKIIAFCLLLIIGIIYYYEDFKEVDVEIPMQEVIVFKEDVPENIIIKNEMLVIEKKYSEDVKKEKDVITSMEDIEGKVTIVPIYKGELIKKDRLIEYNEDFNNNMIKTEISLQLNEIDRALNIKKGEYIDIWLEPIDFTSEILPQKIFSKLKVTNVTNNNKQIIDEKKDYTETDGKISSYITLYLTDNEIENLYNIDKKLNNIRISRYNESDLYKIIQTNLIKEQFNNSNEVGEEVDGQAGN